MGPAGTGGAFLATDELSHHFGHQVSLGGGDSIGTFVFVNPCGDSSEVRDYTAPSSPTNPVCIGATVPVTVTWDIGCSGSCC